jgi:hypothetical protein
MAIVYIKLHRPLHDDLPLSRSLFDSRCEIEYLKSAAPDDGEAISHQGRYGIACPDSEWQDVVETLKQSGESLVYSVVKQGADGEVNIAEAGELNSEVLHYTTRSHNRKQIFAFWFEDCLPERQLRRAA